ncbi:shikimate dehydrogenase [Chelativorans sp. AA-79]|uniref:shikimate dehydrogenase n=1 Tax=Chelativorans sp. AA-79 TaxID=3028735 RepID=UPI0023F7F324|nr:shikimate dehydrogenase [Chelativorans sp. AA-79]WEX09609.1 shikimate dehydrogenase [Chelativorans sp. AA-79]
MADPFPRAFVCGHPIGHSRSPIIHGHWLAEHHLGGSYERLDIAPEEFQAFVRELPLTYVGGNVTIPHKEHAHRLTDRHDEAAEIIGAVNTLWLEDGRLWGGNTDAYGFAANLDAAVPDWEKKSAATVLGAGGAALAIVHALQSRGVNEIRIVNRTLARAQALVDHFRGSTSAHGWEAVPELLSDTEILINTTSLGMHGEPEVMLDLSPLPASAIVTDIVYVPLQTPLLTRAAERGLRTVDGLGMLLHQAAPGFARWFGVWPQVSTRLREIVVADLEDEK